MLPTIAPFAYYTEVDGSPLDNGSVYFGTAGLNPETNPITVYWDLAGTQPAAQPIKTAGGYPVRNGIAGTIYASGNYSTTIKDKQGRLVQYLANSIPFQMFSNSGLGAVVDSIAALKALPKTGNPRVFVTGYYAVGDGGGGQYYYDPTDTTSTDNGGTIIVATDGGRWKMILTSGSVSVKQFGAKGDGSTPDNTPFNNWSKVICGTGIIGILSMPSSYYRLTASWNCSNTQGASSSGLIIRGAGTGCNVQFEMTNDNIQIGWDLVGRAYLDCKDFSVIGGSGRINPGTGLYVTGNNNPRATVLMGSAEGNGFGTHTLRVFGGLYVFERVIFANGGDFVIANEGGEQIDYIDCEAYGWSAAGTAVPFLYTAGGSANLLTSPNTVINNPVYSMSSVGWHGPRAVQQSHGSRIIIFHYTTAGGVIDIKHDGYCLVAAANPFIIMGDDTGGAIAATSISGCGMRDVIVEASGSTANLIVCKNQTSSSGDWIFHGRISVGVALTAAQFQFTNDPFSGTIDWIPNSYGGAWNGVALVTSPSGGGLKINTSIPTPTGNIDSIFAPGGDNFAVSGAHNYTHKQTGTDWNEIGSPTLRGPRANGQLNVFARIRAGARVSTESDGYWGITTTQNVTGAGATPISSPVFAGLVFVTGFDGINAVFADVLLVTLNTVNVIQGASAQGAPAARAYSIVANALNLVMAAGTYDIQVTQLGMGVQV